jgi:hypothetical protein
MVVVLGNGSATEDNFVKPPSGGLSPLVFVSNMGCWRWEGDITVKYTNPDGGPNQTTTTHLVLANPADIPNVSIPIRPFGEFIVQSATTTTTIDGSSSWQSVSQEDPNIVSSENCTYSGGGTFAWDDSRAGYSIEMIPFATGGDLYRKSWLESGGSPGSVPYKSDCTFHWTEKHLDDNGNPYYDSHDSSSSSDSTLTPELWPPGLGSGNKMDISGDGAGIVGNLTSEDGDTEYGWNLKALRQ